MSKLQMHRVEEDEAGIRLDRWFKRHFPHVTNGQLNKMLRTGQVRVAGKRAETSSRLEIGQEIRVPPQVIELPKSDIERRASRSNSDLQKLVIFEDGDVLVLNKPAGLAVQGGTGIRENIDDMLASFADASQERPKLVHRLDRDTSGALVVAKNVFSASRLAESFRHRDTQKIYWGITLGVPRSARGRIDVSLLKKGETMSVVDASQDGAKTSVTVYQILEQVLSSVAFVALWPLTGRTHQLRVHMEHIGHPLLGDPIYGRAPDQKLPFDQLGKGLHLHARRLIIPHPRKGTIDVSAPLGNEMRKTWKYFGFDANANADFSEA